MRSPVSRDSAAISSARAASNSVRGDSPASTRRSASSASARLLTTTAMAPPSSASIAARVQASSRTCACDSEARESLSGGCVLHVRGGCPSRRCTLSGQPHRDRNGHLRFALTRGIAPVASAVRQLERRSFGPPGRCSRLLCLWRLPSRPRPRELRRRAATLAASGRRQRSRFAVGSSARSREPARRWSSASAEAEQNRALHLQPAR